MPEVEEGCDALQKRYFQQYKPHDRLKTWKSMKIPCRIKTWFDHKYRRATRLFSKIKVGDYVYTKNVPGRTPLVGIVTKITKDQVFFKHNAMLRQFPIKVVKKMTFEQSGSLNQFKSGDNVADRTDETKHGVVVGINPENPDVLYVQSEQNEEFIILKNNAELITTTLGGRRKTRRKTRRK